MPILRVLGDGETSSSRMLVSFSQGLWNPPLSMSSSRSRLEKLVVPSTLHEGFTYSNGWSKAFVEDDAHGNH